VAASFHYYLDGPDKQPGLTVSQCQDAGHAPPLGARASASVLESYVSSRLKEGALYGVGGIDPPEAELFHKQAEFDAETARAEARRRRNTIAGMRHGRAGLSEAPTAEMTRSSDYIKARQAWWNSSAESAATMAVSMAPEERAGSLTFAEAVQHALDAASRGGKVFIKRARWEEVRFRVAPDGWICRDGDVLSERSLIYAPNILATDWEIVPE
jgi:hypothetical protein